MEIKESTLHEIPSQTVATSWGALTEVMNSLKNKK